MKNRYIEEKLNQHYICIGITWTDRDNISNYIFIHYYFSVFPFKCVKMDWMFRRCCSLMIILMIFWMCTCCNPGARFCCSSSDRCSECNFKLIHLLRCVCYHRSVYVNSVFCVIVYILYIYFLYNIYFSVCWSWLVCVIVCWIVLVCFRDCVLLCICVCFCVLFCGSVCYCILVCVQQQSKIIRLCIVYSVYFYKKRGGVYDISN